MNLNSRILGEQSASSTHLADKAVLARRIDETHPAEAPAEIIADPYAELKTRVHRACIAKLGTSIYALETTAALASRVKQTIADELRVDGTPLTRQERVNLEQQLADDILGYGPLEPYLNDDAVTEIMVNGSDQVYVERAGRIYETGSCFIDDSHLLRIIDRIVSQVGRRIDESSPMVDARLPDGSRVNAIIAPLALRGPSLTVRKFSRDPFTLGDLVAFGTLTAEAGQFLSACVQGKLNILISGGTGSGKTTALNALSAFVPGDERIVTIEDAAELQLQQRHVVALESRPPNIEGQGEIRIRELVRNALRMRPDRIIVGEVRGAETLDMLQAMNTGHDGSLTTIHANSPRDALHRLEMLVLMAGVELPIKAIREQSSSAFDLIIHVARAVDGSRRVTHVTEVSGMEGDVVTLQDIFSSRSGDDLSDVGMSTQIDPLRPSGLRPNFLGKLRTNGVEVPSELFGAGFR
jgi:pilus assembly protein CpaF